MDALEELKVTIVRSSEDYDELIGMQTATLKCGDLLRHYQDQYQRLLEKYKILKGKHEGSGTTNNDLEHTEASNCYIAVLIDSHSHKVGQNTPLWFHPLMGSPVH